MTNKQILTKAIDKVRNSNVSISGIELGRCVVESRKNKDTAEVKWFPTAGNQVNLFYKENISKGWTHSVPDELNDGYIQVRNLNPRESYTFGIMQKNNCGSGEMVIGIVIDPPASTPTLFRMNYWVWQ